MIQSFWVNFYIWCEIRVQLHAFACGFPVFPAPLVRDKGSLLTQRGEAGLFDKGISPDTPPPHLGSSPCPPHPNSSHCLLQVHKFLNRNRDHLDPAVVEMLAQSQLQVPLPVLPRSLLCHTLYPQSALLARTLLLKCPRAPGTLDRGLARPGSLGAGGRRDYGQVPPLSPQLVGSLFRDAEPEAGGGRDKPTLASRFQQSLGDLLARLGR